MRAIARIVALLFAVASLALAGASTALADSAGAATPASYDLHASWCFDDSPGLVYCFDVDGKAHFVDNTVGSSMVVNERFHTTFIDDGTVIGESTDISLLRGVYRADGTVTTQEVVRTRASLGGQTCRFGIVYRIADYELVVDHVQPAVCV
jgi:hypothetical protein